MGFSSLAFFFIYFFFAILPALMQKPKIHDPLSESLPDFSADGNVTVDFKNNKGALNDSTAMSNQSRYDNWYIAFIILNKDLANSE